MKTLFVFAVLLLTVPAFAQERGRHFQVIEPQLYELQGAHVAAGLVQSPNGYCAPISAQPMPAESLVAVYGQFLSRNRVTMIILYTADQEQVLNVAVYPYLFKTEYVFFRLPADIHGEVWIHAIGNANSNAVRIFVQ